MDLLPLQVSNFVKALGWGRAEKLGLAVQTDPCLNQPQPTPNHSLQCVPGQSPALQLPMGTSIHSLTRRVGQGQGGLPGPFRYLSLTSNTDMTGEQRTIRKLAKWTPHTRLTRPAHSSRQTQHTLHPHGDAHSPLPPHTQTHTRPLTHTRLADMA